MAPKVPVWTLGNGYWTAIGPALFTPRIPGTNCSGALVMSPARTGPFGKVSISANDWPGEAVQVRSRSPWSYSQPILNPRTPLKLVMRRTQTVSPLAGSPGTVTAVVVLGPEVYRLLDPLPVVPSHIEYEVAPTPAVHAKAWFRLLSVPPGTGLVTAACVAAVNV